MIPEIPRVQPIIGFQDLDSTPITYRIEDLLTMEGNLLINAYRKTGKTSLILNLLAALTSPERFLGCYETVPVMGTVVYINVELHQSMLRKYCLDMGIDKLNDRVLFQDYRGQVSRFDILDEAWRMDYVDMLRDVKARALVMDPIQPMIAMHGGNSNDNDEARKVVEHFSQIAADAGIDHFIAVDHTGHLDKTRARGASGKEDWADVIWNITKDGEGVPERTLTATGRGVDYSCRYTMRDGKLAPIEPPKDGEITTKGLVIRELRRCPLTVADLSAKVGKERSTIAKILGEMLDFGQAKRVGKQGQAEVWQLVP